MSRDFLGSLSHPLSPPLPTRAHLRFPLSFLFSVSSVSLNPMASLRGDVSLTACVLIRIWCVSCLTQNPAGWTFTSFSCSLFPSLWWGWLIYTSSSLGWLKDLRTSLDSSTGVICRASTILHCMVSPYFQFMIPHSMEVSGQLNFLHGSWFPAREKADAARTVKAWTLRSWHISFITCY